MTTVTIKEELPPNWEQIHKTFAVSKASRVLYAYFPNIYNPTAMVVPPPLITHECVHLDRQRENVEQWWESYCDNMRFRLMEELLAHRAEYIAVCNHPNTNRAQKRAYLVAISKRLASPLYGCQVRAKTIKSLLPAMDDPAVMKKVLDMEAQVPFDDGTVT
jgi:hypothetical protein